MNESHVPVRSHPNSASLRDREYVLHPMTNLMQHLEEGPLLIERGDGVYVEDDEGRRYIEGVSGLWSISLGFSQKRLARVAADQMLKLPSYHMFRFKSHNPGIELAEHLIRIAPVPMSKVLFANSGSEANDTAIKLVWYYNNALGRSQKKKIIGRKGGYHGVTVAAGSITGLYRNHWDFDLPIPGMLHTDCPHHWRFGLSGESEEAFATRMAESLEKLILSEGPDTVAAFFAEPVMGSGGVIVPPRTYFEKIQSVLRKYDVMFIVDEVICGFGRLGDMFGTTTYNLRPDMMTLAKGLSSGYLPISALLVSDRIWEACLKQSGKIGVFGHGFTYSGHPVCAAVANEVQKIYDEMDILTAVREVTPVLQDGLRAYSDHPLVGEVRGCGLMAGIELVRNRKTKEPFPPEANVGLYIERRCQAHGAILRSLGDVLTAAPPLVISRDEVRELNRIVGVALDETLAFARKEKLI